MNDWKTMIGLDDCDVIFPIEHDEASYEVDLPFIPRIGDFVWLPDECNVYFDDYIKKCWEEHRCKDCPYIFGAQESTEDISTIDAITVARIIHDIERRRTIIYMSLK